ncbi:AAA domain-containing protein [Nocardia cyriacigeorgica]|uniref:AAA domain-containing protein n=1 Tax=Nocardia cyriacigeorgica TaxID=135487 RepID=UPI002B4B3BB0|nr:AAA domain-containing protein [Nocardia cyriacigeorgica]
MFGDRVVSTAADLARAARCEFAMLHALDADLGTASDAPAATPPPGSAEADRRAERALLLAQLRRRHGDDLVAIGGFAEQTDLDRADGDVAAALTTAHAETLAALRAKAPVIAGAVFFDGEFACRADFLVRAEHRVRYRVHGVTGEDFAIASALELAGCAAAIEAAGIPVDPLIAQSHRGRTHTLPLAELLPVYHARRARVGHIVDEKLGELLPAQWGDPRYLACGRCAVCVDALTAARDLLLVAGMSGTARARLRESGIGTIDRLATTTGPLPSLPEVGPRTLLRLRRQAEIQLRPDDSGRPAHTVIDPAALGALPVPTPGDLALTIGTAPAGDTQAGTARTGRDVGPADQLRVELADAAGVQLSLLVPAALDGVGAETRAQQRAALDQVLEAIAERRRGHPDLHVFHYTSAVRSALLCAGGRFGASEDLIDELLRGGVFVDLYPIVRSALLIGVDSYEPARLRALLPDTGLVVDGGHDCVTVLRLRDWLLDRAAEQHISPAASERHRRSDGSEPLGRPTPLEAALAEFAERVPQAAHSTANPVATPAVPAGPGEHVPAATTAPTRAHAAAGAPRDPDTAVPNGGNSGEAAAGSPGSAAVVNTGTAAVDYTGPASDAGADLRPRRPEHEPPAPGSTGQRTDTESIARQVASLMAAALGYRRRERQPLWWAHADRLTHPVDEWPEAPGVLVAEWSTVDTKWHIGPHGDSMRRFITLTGRMGAGSGLAPGTAVYTFYDRPVAEGMVAAAGTRATATATVLGCSVDAEFDDTVRLEERLPAGCAPFDDLPAAIAPGLPAADTHVDAAIEHHAQQLLVTLPRIPAGAIFDILACRPPRLRGGAPLPRVHGDYAAAITEAVRALDDSYVAVQGPPGTGKTVTAARVIERMVTRHRWRVGVVAPTPAIVENLLDAVVEVGVLPQLVAKKDVTIPAPEWAVIDAGRYRRFLDNAINGCVIGGAPADFADPELVPYQDLDLLVVADAGRFPLADAIAAAASARNLLVIGDPVPAPATAPSVPFAPAERTGAAHPEPVGESVLGRLIDGRDTLPTERGYFLDRTWRMHPKVAEPISRLYYDGRLRASDAVTLARRLADTEPGIHTVLVEHHGNATESVAEAREVVRRVRALLGLTWTIGATTRRLHPHDIFVVTPYRAQVARISTLLARAKIDDVLVGTPELFRGREAAVVIVSLASSSPADAPHGLSTLLSRALVQGALCRALWKAIIVRSPLLTEYLPSTPAQLTELSRFLRLG